MCDILANCKVLGDPRWVKVLGTVGNCSLLIQRREVIKKLVFQQKIGGLMITMLMTFLINIRYLKVFAVTC